ncbi:MAG: SDR family NAD(P)-dependent oxidoreductase [Ruminococcaceae bacterium]|nr:SDR family NAD(P)-dependent oxidoreductase [Oscillospiraceae bacterium]
MNCKKWFLKNTEGLKGKTVAVSGSTGGIGVWLCRHLAALGADLVLLNRSKEKTDEQILKLKTEFPNIKAEFIPCDLSDIKSVKAATDALIKNCPDYLIHNAGAYSIPRYITDCGFDNVFMINFLSPYYITKTLLPYLEQKGGRVVAVGSIAHNYSKTNPKNIDFRTVKAASKAYGNAKRHLMLSFYRLFENEKGVSLSVVHPGITFTNITAHYPKVIFAIIKHPMKIIFMKPKKAALCILRGIFEKTEYGFWIGPRLLDIWGLPSKKKLKTFDKAEADLVFETAEECYGKVLDFLTR